MRNVLVIAGSVMLNVSVAFAADPVVKKVLSCFPTAGGKPVVGGSSYSLSKVEKENQEKGRTDIFYRLESTNASLPPVEGAAKPSYDFTSGKLTFIERNNLLVITQDLGKTGYVVAYFNTQKNARSYLDANVYNNKISTGYAQELTCADYKTE